MDTQTGVVDRSSVDVLFEQPFEPLWMKWQREHFEQECQTAANEAWRVMALETASRIARKWRDLDHQGRPKIKP